MALNKEIKTFAQVYEIFVRLRYRGLNQNVNLVAHNLASVVVRQTRGGFRVLTCSLLTYFWHLQRKLLTLLLTPYGESSDSKPTR